MEHTSNYLVTKILRAKHAHSRKLATSLGRRIKIEPDFVFPNSDFKTKKINPFHFMNPDKISDDIFSIYN